MRLPKSAVKFFLVQTFFRFCLIGLRSRAVSALSAGTRNLSRGKKLLNIRKGSDTTMASNIQWFDEVTSTMDKAKELMNVSDISDSSFAVVARRQTNGRGTKGRTWVSPPGNLFMTIAINLSLVPIPLTLVPLRIGTLIAPIMQSFVSDDSAVFLKWPNDVLIQQKKICGVLMEIENGKLFIGIGCNIIEAPPVELTGKDGGRPATCLIDHLSPDWREAYQDLAENVSLESSNADDGSNPSDSTKFILAENVASAIYVNVMSWIGSADSSAAVTSDFMNYVDMSPQRIRSESSDPQSSSDPINVTPIRINTDGTLQVLTSNGSEKTLVADYLW